MGLYYKGTVDSPNVYFVGTTEARKSVSVLPVSSAQSSEEQLKDEQDAVKQYETTAKQNSQWVGRSNVNTFVVWSGFKTHGSAELPWKIFVPFTPESEREDFRGGT